MESDSFWEFYWQVRLEAIEGLGKREAVLEASRLVRQREAAGLPCRLLELGCGAGQVIGALVGAHAAVPGVHGSLGVDYSTTMLAKARREQPGLSLLQADFGYPARLELPGRFDLVLLVNSLHEVFSNCFSAELGEVDVPAGKAAVRRVLTGLPGLLNPGGQVLIFDGLEPEGDPFETMRVRFLQPAAREELRAFEQEYHPFRPRVRWLEDGWRAELPRRDLVRFLDKSIFIRKPLWETERLESYQYFTEAEFRSGLDAAGLAVQELRTLTVNDDHWRSRVEIETPGVDFHAEHVLIVAGLRAL